MGSQQQLPPTAELYWGGGEKQPLPAPVWGLTPWRPAPCAPCSEQKHVYLGDKNALNLTFHAQNVGEGGAYEAELWVTAPPEAEYSGLVRHPGVREDARAGRGWGMHLVESGYGGEHRA